MSAVRCDSVGGPLPRPRYAPQPESSDHPAASLVARETQLSCHDSSCADASSLQSPHRRKTPSLPEAPGTREDDEVCGRVLFPSHEHSTVMYSTHFLFTSQPFSPVVKGRVMWGTCFLKWGKP
ncbi:hypothetical protein MHYP_G00298690 [Metynnis hypsauchen]